MSHDKTLTMIFPSALIEEEMLATRQEDEEEDFIRTTK